MVEISAKGWESLEQLCETLNIDLVDHVGSINLGIVLANYHPEYAAAFIQASGGQIQSDQDLADAFVRNVPLEGILTP